MLDAGLVWFRRDLRADDNAALAAALAGCRRVHCAFVFDRAILDELNAAGIRSDRRVDFIHRSAAELDRELRARGGALVAVHDRAADAIPRLAQELQVDAVFANRDYEPYARARDQQVERRLADDGRPFLTFKDQVIFERGEIVTGAGRPYAVFTAYANAWRRRLAAQDLAQHDTRGPPGCLATSERGWPTLADLGFVETDLAAVPLKAGSRGAHAAFEDFLQRIDGYDQARNFPAQHGTSQLSVHLRFGTISIRELVRAAIDRPGAGAQAWLNELIWREFYQMILWHHPHVEQRAYRPEFDAINWEHGEIAEQRFAAWSSGRTGYPLVDAAMRQLNATGAMHNRLRMVSASFLAKHLGVDWRRGERYFAHQLNDYDLAANNGGWQWSASTGCDAQPYFRIFNPVAQSEKFDPAGAYLRRWLPELAGFTDREIHTPWRTDVDRQRTVGCVIGTDYPAPIVDHAEARRAALMRYSAARR
jgi:deoxyribodipyrimidine photo-lyase